MTTTPTSTHTQEVKRGKRGRLRGKMEMKNTGHQPKSNIGRGGGEGRDAARRTWAGGIKTALREIEQLRGLGTVKG